MPFCSVQSVVNRKYNFSSRTFIDTESTSNFNFSLPPYSLFFDNITKFNLTLEDNQLAKYTPCFYDTPVDGVYFPDGCSPYCANLYMTCNISFIVWAGPLIISVILLFLSFLCSFLMPESHASAPPSFAKVFMMILFGLWVTASLSGAGYGLITTFAQFAMSACVSIAMLCVAVYGAPKSSKDLT